jgi:hypothetical protein
MTDLPRILTDKQTLRDRSAAKPFSKKLQILEKLRDRDRSIRSTRVSAPTKRTPAKKQ